MATDIARQKESPEGSGLIDIRADCLLAIILNFRVSKVIKKLIIAALDG